MNVFHGRCLFFVKSYHNQQHGLFSFVRTSGLGTKNVLLPQATTFVVDLFQVLITYSQAAQPPPGSRRGCTTNLLIVYLIPQFSFGKNGLPLTSSNNIYFS